MPEKFSSFRLIDIHPRGHGPAKNIARNGNPESFGQIQPERTEDAHLAQRHPIGGQPQ